MRHGYSCVQQNKSPAVTPVFLASVQQSARVLELPQTTDDTDSVHILQEKDAPSMKLLPSVNVSLIFSCT